MVSRLSGAAAQAALNAITGLIAVGSGSAFLRLYNGSRPADPAVAVTTQVKLLEVTLPSPAFPNAATVVSSVATNVAADLPVTNGLATGTATWFRVTDKNGLGIIDGDVTEYPGTGALQVPTAAVTNGQPYAIQSWTVTHSQ